MAEIKKIQSLDWTKLTKEEIEKYQEKIDRYNKLMSGMKATQGVAIKVMEAVDPSNVQQIVMAMFTGCMSCLVTLKDQQLSIITQGMDVGKQLAHNLRA